MRKFLVLGAKLAAAAAGLLAVGAVVGTVALKKYLPPEKVRELITENSRKFLHREVRLQSVDLNAVKGLTIAGLEVSEAPDFKAGTFAKADNFQLRVRLAALLHGSVAVDRLAVGGLKLSVKRAADGRFNFSDITASSAAAKSPASGAKPLPMELDVSRVSLADGRIDYSDASTGDRLTLSELNAQLSDVSLDGETAADFSMKVSGSISKKPVSAAVAFDGTVDAAKLDLDKLSVAMKKASVQTPSGKLTVSGKLKGAKAPEFDLKTETIVGGSAPILAEVSGKLSELSAKASGSVAVKAHVPALAPAELSALGAPKGLVAPPADVDAKLELSGELLTLKSLEFKTGAGSVQASGTVDKFRSAPVADLTIAAKLDAPALSASDLKILKLDLPPDLMLPAFKLEADARIQGETAQVKSLHFAADGAKADVSGSVRKLRSGKPEPDLSVELKASAPKVTPLAIAVLKARGIEVPASLSGRSAEIAASVRLAPAGLEVKSFHLDSQGSVIDASGRPPQMDLSIKLALPELASADLVFLKAYKVEVPQGLTLPATKLDAKLHYAPDDVAVSEFRFENAYANAKASGAVHKIKSGHPQGTVNGSASLRLPAMTAKDLAFLKLIPNFKVPDGVSWPATSADAQFKYDGSALETTKLHIQNGKIGIDGSASVRGFGGAPEATVDLKTNLPAFASDDVAFVAQVPAGLKIPASKVEVRAKASKDAFDIGFLKLETGKNTLMMKGTAKKLGSGKPLFNLTAISPGFVLEELADLSPETRQMGLKGVGRFKVFAAEVPGLGNAYTGDIEFRGVKMTVAGIGLSEFAGKGDFDKDRIRFPSITGKIDGAALDMDLSVKNYLRSPVIDIQKGTLESVDAGKLLAAKDELAKGKKTEPGAAPKPFGLKIWDWFTVGRITHPYATIDKAALKCDLAGISPDFKQLDGTAKFSTGGGHLTDLDKIAERYPLFKVLALPILLMRGIGLFPNLSDIAFSRLDGDYEITKGVVDVKSFVLDGDKLTVSSNQGKLDLPGDRVFMDVSAKIGVIPKHMVMCGKISSPSTNCKSLLQKGVDAVGGAVQVPVNVLENISK